MTSFQSDASDDARLDVCGFDVRLQSGRRGRTDGRDRSTRRRSWAEANTLQSSGYLVMQRPTGLLNSHVTERCAARTQSTGAYLGDLHLPLPWYEKVELVEFNVPFDT